MINLHKKTLAARELVDELYHEICHRDQADLEDLELAIGGALSELHQAVELIEEMIDQESA